MCLSTEAFALFLNLLAFDMLTMEPQRVIVHAAVRDAHWVAVDDRWCTMAPQIDRLARFDAPAE